MLFSSIPGGNRLATSMWPFHPPFLPVTPLSLLLLARHRVHRADSSFAIPDKADKPKREPTAYQLFCKAHMKEWNEKNPGRAKEAMAQVGVAFCSMPSSPHIPCPPHHGSPLEGLLFLLQRTRVDICAVPTAPPCARVL